MRKKHIIVIPRFLYPMVLEDQRWTGPGTQGREVFVDGGVEVAAFASCKSLASSEGVTKPPWNMALNNRAKETEKNARFARYRHNSNSYCIYASSGFSYSYLALFIKHRTSAPKCWSRCVFDRKPSLLWGNVLLFFFQAIRPWFYRSEGDGSDQQLHDAIPERCLGEKFPAKQLLQPPKVVTVTYCDWKIFLAQKCSSFNRWVMNKFGAWWLYLFFFGGGSRFYSSCQWVIWVGLRWGHSLQPNHLAGCLV